MQVQMHVIVSVSCVKSQPGLKYRHTRLPVCMSCCPALLALLAAACFEKFGVALEVHRQAQGLRSSGCRH